MVSVSEMGLTTIGSMLFPCRLRIRSSTVSNKSRGRSLVPSPPMELGQRSRMKHCFQLQSSICQQIFLASLNEATNADSISCQRIQYHIDSPTIPPGANPPDQMSSLGWKRCLQPEYQTLCCSITPLFHEFLTVSRQRLLLLSFPNSNPSHPIYKYHVSQLLMYYSLETESINSSLISPDRLTRSLGMYISVVF